MIRLVAALALALALPLLAPGSLALAEPDARPEPPVAAAAGLESRPSTPLWRGDSPGDAPRVVINELANGGERGGADGFFELRNAEDSAVELSGWNVYRCDRHGLRRNDGHGETSLEGITLAPGEILTVARVGARLGAGTADRVVTESFAAAGFGLMLVEPGGTPVDMVGVYPNAPWPMRSECSAGANLPNSLNFARGESWQRVADTGEPGRDFVTAAATPDAENATQDAGRATAHPSGVLISELAPAGPRSAGDDFVELRNYGTRGVDIGGWRLFRCTATGRVTAETRQLTIGTGTELAPGAAFLIGGPGFGGDADARTEVSLADETFGVVLEARDGALVDELGVSPFADTGCQAGSEKLPAILDFARAESWQRVGRSGEPLADFIVAPRTPGRDNAREEDSLFRSALAYPERPGVAISEIATDPAPRGMPPGFEQRNFIELANFGDQTVDIGGWRVFRCEAGGGRHPEPQLTVDLGTRLAPGASYLAAREGTALADRADARYPVALNLLGAGVWVENAAGERVDSVGVYQANEMDQSNEAPSPCTKGVSLVTYEPDRMRGETFQRARFTGVDYDDFVVGAATPGDTGLRDWVDRALPLTDALRAVVLPVTTADEPLWRGPEGIEPLRVLGSYSGVSEQAPARERAVPGEHPGARAETDAGYGYPFQRFELDPAGLDGEPLVWSGTTVAHGEVQLSLWQDGAWAPHGTGRADARGRVEIEVDVPAALAAAPSIGILVQNGPPVASPFADRPDGRFERPEDYDLALAHLSDTQYLSEAYPEVYAEMAAWIVANHEARKIAFATHTGDLVQNWVDPDQNELRARREFERASGIQAVLDDAGVPNSVLPGNHDAKRGLDPALFNEFFGPSRYAGEPWYGGSLAPDDNSANYSTVEAGGARFLMLSLPYAYGERELDWAEGVVAAHPGHNVVVSTHEHLSPKTRDRAASRSTNSRWVSRADELWNRVIAPNRNVVLVLAGHFHGLGQIVTENAGGLEGHTVVELLADYQEFRTHTGERATGFQRLLQLDLASGRVAVDTFSQRLDATASADFDYAQYIQDHGDPLLASNARPWRIVEHGLQRRYTAVDDEFTVGVRFMHDKTIDTAVIGVPRPPSSALG